MPLIAPPAFPISLVPHFKHKGHIVTRPPTAPGWGNTLLRLRASINQVHWDGSPVKYGHSSCAVKSFQQCAPRNAPYLISLCSFFSLFFPQTGAVAPPGSQHGLSRVSIGVVLVVSRCWPRDPSPPTAAGFWVLDTFTASMEDIKITLGAKNMRAHR